MNCTPIKFFSNKFLKRKENKRYSKAHQTDVNKKKQSHALTIWEGRIQSQSLKQDIYNAKGRNSQPSYNSSEYLHQMT